MSPGSKDPLPPPPDELGALQQFLAGYKVEFWRAKASLLRQAIEDDDLKKAIRPEEEGEGTFPQSEELDNIWKIEAFFNEYHSTEALFSVFHAFQRGGLRKVWSEFVYQDKKGLRTFVGKIAQDGLDALVTDQGHPMDRWFPGHDEPPLSEVEEFAEMMDGVPGYLRTLAQRFWKTKAFNAYKHGLGLRIAPLTVEIEPTEGDPDRKVTFGPYDTLSFVDLESQQGRRPRRFAHYHVPMNVDTSLRVAGINATLIRTAIELHRPLADAGEPTVRLRAYPEIGEAFDDAPDLSEWRFGFTNIPDDVRQDLESADRDKQTEGTREG